MKLERNCLSSSELSLGVFCFMHATVLRSGFIIGTTKQDSWIVTIMGFLLSLVLIVIYSTLFKKFPGKNLVEINGIVFGNILGKVISALYLFFFLSLAALNTRDAGSFITTYSMTETPIEAISFIFVIGCVYSIQKGIKNVIRLSTAVFIVTMVAMVINSGLIVKDADLKFLAPLFQLEPQKYIQGTVTVSAVPMGEVLAFTMLIPMLKNNEKAAKPFFFGMLISTITMVIVILRDIITLGPLVSVVSLPTFEAIRYVSLGDVLTRMESIYAVVLIILYLIKVSILLYISILGLNQILGTTLLDSASESDMKGLITSKRKAPPLLLITAAFLFFYSNFVFESTMDNMHWGASVAPFFSLTFEFFLPAVTLLTAHLRNIGKKKEIIA